MQHAIMPNRARSQLSSSTYHARAGIHIVEVASAAVVVVVLLALALPACHKARSTQYQLKDSTQVRGIMQAMVIFAQSNNDKYPLPSELDLAHTTLADPGEGQQQEKDTTRHIVSVLIKGGFISPEICISPQEVNADFEAYEGYEYDAPKAAAAEDKALALWDPAFRALPTDGDGAGGFSYAHSLPFGERLARWGQTFNATEAVLGNRGPAYESARSDERSVFELLVSESGPSDMYDTPVGTTSNTLLIHGTRDKWVGNIGFNDNHVEFSNKPDPDSISLAMPGDKSCFRTFNDNVFVNEDDETLEAESLFGVPLTSDNDNRNAYLRSYSAVRVGESGYTLDFFWD